MENVRNELGTRLLRLGLVNVLHQHTLVLEDVTLSLHVKDVVPASTKYRQSYSSSPGLHPITIRPQHFHLQVPVDLARLTVLAQQTTEDTHAAHPEDSGGHTGLSGTVTLTGAGVTAETLSRSLLADTETRVGGFGLADDKTILGKLADVLACCRLVGGVVEVSVCSA